MPSVAFGSLENLEPPTGLVASCRGDVPPWHKSVQAPQGPGRFCPFGRRSKGLPAVPVDVLFCSGGRWVTMCAVVVGRGMASSDPS